jgi:hypothetical protein
MVKVTGILHGSGRIEGSGAQELILNRPRLGFE